ncbi:hypothetical protein AAG570_004366 [Ranatra chinensis]|uniref:Ribosomal protein S14 n=1 Tax=Ranatra chinensis TaxID=642074 RepID=A0ABD0Y0Y1_9HEMI
MVVLMIRGQWNVGRLSEGKRCRKDQKETALTGQAPYASFKEMEKPNALSIRDQAVQRDIFCKKRKGGRIKPLVKRRMSMGGRAPEDRLSVVRREKLNSIYSRIAFSKNFQEYEIRTLSSYRVL